MHTVDPARTGEGAAPSSQDDQLCGSAAIGQGADGLPNLYPHLTYRHRLVLWRHPGPAQSHYRNQTLAI